MTNLRLARPQRRSGSLLTGLLALVLAGSASAWQAPPPPIKPAKPVVISPPPGLRFQQVVQEQKVRDQLQKSQQQQQLHRDVSTNARRSTTATDPKVQQQHDQAERAQLERDRARQQDLMDQYRQKQALPRVVPKELPAPDAHGDR